MDKSKSNEEGVIKSFNNQIAGHAHNWKSPGSVGLLKFGDDCVLKPITKPRQGHTEITFYQEIWTSEDTLVGLLKVYVPKYYGLVTLSLDGKDTTFLKLQDLSIGLKKPCIADIKIGAQTWEPNVDQQKRIYEDLKYTQTKKAYGISLTGYQVFDLTTGQLIKRDKTYGKNLTKDSVSNALREFFNIRARGSHIVVQHVLQRLGDMLSWWHQQQVVNIYGSSILILYDAWELDYLYPPKNVEVVKEATQTGAPLFGDLQLECATLVPTEEMHRLCSLKKKLDVSCIDDVCNLSASSILTAKTSLKTTTDTLSDVTVTDRIPSSIPWIRVYMIDFAHVVYPFHPKSDQNYIFGLTNLIKLIQNL